MDDIYANVEKPLDNKSNRQLAGKEGEDIYINNDVIHSTPDTGGTTGNSGHLHGVMCGTLYVNNYESMARTEQCWSIP